MKDSSRSPRVSPKDWIEAEVYDVAPLDKVERIDDSKTFDWLGQTLPTLGTKVEWSSDVLPGRHAHQRPGSDAELVDEAVLQVLQRMNPGSIVVHVGDSGSPFGVRFGHENAKAVVSSILEVPQHHYFVDERRCWLVVVSMEGDLDTLDGLA